MRILRKSIFEMDSKEIAEIESFLAARFCTVFHEVAFNRIAAECLGTEFRYCMVRDTANTLIGLCPLHKVKSGNTAKVYSNPAIYDIRYGGWIFDEQETCITELMQVFGLNWNESLTYWSTPQVDRDAYGEVRHKTTFHTPIIDLSSTIDDIFQKCLTRKRRQTINSALRKGVVVEELGVHNLHIFLGQYEYLKTSIGLNPLPRNFLTRLYEHYHARNMAIVFATKYGKEYLATGMILGNRRMMHLWIAGKPKEISANVPRQDLLVWESVKWAKQMGCRCFDLCYVDELGQHEIAVHKLGFTKTVVPFYCVTDRKICYRILSKLSRIF